MGRKYGAVLESMPFPAAHPRFMPPHAQEMWKNVELNFASVQLRSRDRELNRATHAVGASGRPVALIVHRVELPVARLDAASRAVGVACEPVGILMRPVAQRSRSVEVSFRRVGAVSSRVEVE